MLEIDAQDRSRANLDQAMRRWEGKRVTLPTTKIKDELEGDREAPLHRYCQEIKGGRIPQCHSEWPWTRAPRVMAPPIGIKGKVVGP
jgi:hypothetical protein